MAEQPPHALELQLSALYPQGVPRPLAPHRSPTPGLVLGLIITLAAVVACSGYITWQISGLRELQNNLVDRNRKDSLQLLRIQNDLNTLALAMRDIVDNNEPYPLTAWTAQFQRIRADLDDALRKEEQVAVADRTPEQRQYLGNSMAQFWDAVDRTFALAANGKHDEARSQIQLSLQARQAGARPGIRAFPSRPAGVIDELRRPGPGPLHHQADRGTSRRDDLGREQRGYRHDVSLHAARDQGRGWRIRAEPHPDRRRHGMTGQRFCVPRRIRRMRRPFIVLSIAAVLLTPTIHADDGLRLDWTRQSLTATWRHYTQIVGGMEVEGAGVIERIELPGPDIANRRECWLEHDLHLSAQEIDQRGPAAAISDADKVDAGHEFEQFAGNVGHAAIAGGSHIDLAGIGLRIGNELWGPYSPAPPD